MVSGGLRRMRVGASRLGCLIELIIVGGLIYFAAYAGQDLLDYYRFQDAMKQEARFASKRTDEQIKAQQKIDQAKRDKEAAERQRQYQELEKKLGI